MKIESDSDHFDLYFSDEPIVEATSHYPKSLSRIAENVTIITAEQIEAANVHTLAEILDRAAGVFVSYNGQDFGSSATLFIHGSTISHNHHTLVLLDGVKYNYSSSGTAETNGIPVAIIKRMEIIKGPASSAWGSALGGVINIVTKDSGRKAIPENKIFLSCGESQTSDIRAERKGKIEAAGYYLYAGKQSSDGLRDNRFFDNENIYGKLNFALPHRSDLQLSTFYTRPEQKYFDWAANNLSLTGKSRDFLTALSFNSSLYDNLDLNITADIFSRKLIQGYSIIVDGFFGLANGLFQDNVYLEENRSISSRLVYSGEKHTLAGGIEYKKTELDKSIINGQFFQALGQNPEDVGNTAKEEHWAVYLNDTYRQGKLTVIPGIRYDYHSITDDFISPSLGTVYQLRPSTLLRASVARGFSRPYLGTLAERDTLFSATNPDLDPEKIWSYQAGLETFALDICRLKATVFFHDIHNLWSRESGKPVNKGKNERLGYELELETIPLHDLSLSANFTSIYEDNTEVDNDHLYNFNILLSHDNPELWRTELTGHYVWWQDRDSINGHYNDFLWDLNLSKKTTLQGMQVKLFLQVHNIFNSSQYWWDLIENPGRWGEGGISLSF